MRKNKTEISNAETYDKIGGFWDTYDILEIEDISDVVGFEAAIKSEVTYYAHSKHVAEKIESIALKHGVSQATLL